MVLDDLQNDKDPDYLNITNRNDIEEDTMDEDVDSEQKEQIMLYFYKLFK